MKLFATLLLLLISAAGFDAGAAHSDVSAAFGQAPGRTYGPQDGRIDRRRQSRAMNDSDFGVLYDRVKGKSFTADKLELVEVGSLGTGFTSAQCTRILSLFTFDDDRMKALRLMAPRLVDPGNAETIIESFTFDSGRKEATKIIFDSMKSRPQGR